VIIRYRADIFVIIFIEVAVSIIRHGIVRSSLAIGVEAPGGSTSGGHGILDAVYAVGVGGIGVAEVVDLAVGAGAAVLVVARALQGLDVAAQVVGEGFVVLVAVGDAACIAVFVEGGAR
jgi:hypothetical protein